MATAKQIARKFSEHKITDRGEIVVKTCPLDSTHKDWKMYINPEKGVAHCFICHRLGEGVSLKKLLGGSWRPRRDSSKVTKSRKNKPITPFPEDLSNIYALPKIHIARGYLKSRGVPLSLADERGIVWKDKGPALWQKEDKEIGSNLQGLVIPLQVNGVSKGWQFSPVPRVEGWAKYITAPGSKLRGLLYNWDHAKISDILVVMEGVFDALKLPECAVALFGDGVSKRKKRLISTGGFEEVILCLDGDRTDHHIETQLGKLMGCARSVRAVKLPDDKDPGDLPKDKLMEVLGL